MDAVRRAAIHDALGRLSDGDREPFAVLVDELWPVILSFVERSVGRGADAEDVVQEVFLKMCARIADFDRARHGLSWAFGIASYEIMTHRRRRQRRREVYDDSLVAALPDGTSSQEDQLLASEETLARRTFSKDSAPRIALRSGSMAYRRRRQVPRAGSASSVCSTGCAQRGGTSMVTRDRLLHAGRRAYEMGRIRAAVRVAWLVVPVVAVCALVTGAVAACACVGSAMLGVAVLLRWQSRRAGAAVRDGLVASVLPLLAGLLVTLVSANWTGTALSSEVAVLCAIVALPGGAWMGCHVVRGLATLANWSRAAGVAVLAAALGSAGLDLSAAAGTALGLLLGSAAAIVPFALVKTTRS